MARRNPTPNTDSRTARLEFEALGGTVSIEASSRHHGTARAAVERAEASVRDLQKRLTRFEPDSELSLLNADPRRTVPASPVMTRFVSTVGFAGHLSGGLVDATCLAAVEKAGYTRSLGRLPVQDSVSELAAAGTRSLTAPAGPDPRRSWMAVSADPAAGTVTRPPGTRLDSGGTGKGLAADLAAEELEGLESYAVDCVGDIRFGGTTGSEREVRVASPRADHDPVASLSLASGAVATSGITRRSWLDPDGQPAHHLIDPSTGRPAWTGVLQVSAVAPTGLEAEVRAKSALLSGPGEAAGWLVHGGVIVLEDDRVINVGGGDPGIGALS